MKIVFHCKLFRDIFLKTEYKSSKVYREEENTQTHENRASCAFVPIEQDKFTLKEFSWKTSISPPVKNVNFT